MIRTVRYQLSRDDGSAINAFEGVSRYGLFLPTFNAMTQDDAETVVGALP